MKVSAEDIPTTFIPTIQVWQRDGFDETYSFGSKVIGQGAFSQIYLGKDTVTSESVAIKVVDRSKLVEEEDAQLQAEVAILNDLSHPNIISFFDAYCEPKRYLIVGEYMDGGDLLDLLKDESYLDESIGRDICYPVLSAVAYMHRLFIAHRDLKPENVLLSRAHGVKLADFGFAKKETSPDCFSTLCGTPAYVAPEILKKTPYGAKADMWSLGVLTFALLGGYQPFHGENEKEVQQKIVNGSFQFDDKYWDHISKDARDFIASLLVVDPKDRASSEAVLAHPWFSADLAKVDATTQRSREPVFFMIGSQRSGSNWLRTMLDQREDLVGPHPPHIMREFMPIISKFGDLSVDENFKVLLDHVCSFVERNQVPWTDKYNQNILFCRQTVYIQANDSCKRLKLQEGGALDNELYLLSIFDAIMDLFAAANSKPMWLCKSMGMSAYHDHLIRFYGEERLRYIYLIRDPRDVAMSFMKTPVGDCHFYFIAQKWVKLQHQAIRIVEDTPNLVFTLQYEDLLKDKENVVKSIYEFIGERRFGGVKRQASVMLMSPSEDLVNNAKQGVESLKAHTLSYQFKNLCRGESFAKEQSQKWRHPETGLKKDELVVIESVAWEVMNHFGYKTALVKQSIEPQVYTAAQIDEFQRLNKDGIECMYENLKKENIGDYNRRAYQAEVLKMEPEMLSNPRVWGLGTTMSSNKKASILANVYKQHDVSCEYTEAGQIEGFGTFTCGAVSQKGYYCDTPNKQNQDTFDIRIDIQCTGGHPHHLFGVFDGHGKEGELCSQMSKTMIGDIFEEYMSNGLTTKVALQKAHAETHEILANSETINAENSGTTSVVAVLNKRLLTVGFVGDSVALLGSKNQKRASQLLTRPHDLARSDEVARIERSGGVVLSTEEYDEVKESLRGSFTNRGIQKSASLVDLLECVEEPSLQGNGSNNRASRPATVSDRLKRTISSNSLASAPNSSLRASLGKLGTPTTVHSTSTSSFASINSNEDTTYIPRIWSATNLNKLPGCAFTRSLGDINAHEIGVSERCEFKQIKVQDGDVIIIASDGVTEYLDAENCMKVVCNHTDPTEAADALVKKAVEEWAEKNDYVDDVTAIVIFFTGDEE